MLVSNKNSGQESRSALQLIELFYHADIATLTSQIQSLKLLVRKNIFITGIYAKSLFGFLQKKSTKSSDSIICSKYPNTHHVIFHFNATSG